MRCLLAVIKKDCHKNLQALKELPEKIRKVLEVDAQVLKVAQVDFILNENSTSSSLHSSLSSSSSSWLSSWSSSSSSYNDDPPQELYEKRSLLIMGRGYNYATCLEGALKANDDDDDDDG